MKVRINQWFKELTVKAKKNLNAKEVKKENASFLQETSVCVIRFYISYFFLVFPCFILYFFVVSTL